MNILFWIFYLSGLVPAYAISRYLTRKASKRTLEGYTYGHVAFNILISTFSWLSFTIILFFFIVDKLSDLLNNIKPPNWL